MSKVEIGKCRATITNEPNGLQIRIPTKKNWFLLSFMSFWLCGWGAGEFTVAKKLFSQGVPITENIFVLAWLGAWTIGGFAAITFWLWVAFGEELIIVRPDSLVVKLLVFGRGITREYELSSVTNLKCISNDAFSNVRGWGYLRPSIGFDYGLKTCRFGGGLDEPEALAIVTAIKQQFNI